jgi:PRTRC genetic system protein A
MKELVKFISCVVTPDEFEEVKASGAWSEIYIKDGLNFFKYTKLRGGRHVTVKVPAIPGLVNSADSIKEDINFLPAGKIPATLLHDIIAFFKDVMSTTKQDVEAMAHILWNATDGYHIAVPNQTISKAAVSYGNDHIKEGDIIVLDIHSHNTMGAFFSGTDNADDRNGIYYSGVVGKLNMLTPELVWRFNIGAEKRTALVTDIFEVEVLGKSKPEWLSQVKIRTAPAVPPFNPNLNSGAHDWVNKYKGPNTPGVQGAPRLPSTNMRDGFDNFMGFGADDLGPAFAFSSGTNDLFSQGTDNSSLGRISKKERKAIQRGEGVWRNGKFVPTTNVTPITGRSYSETYVAGPLDMDGLEGIVSMGDMGYTESEDSVMMNSLMSEDIADAIGTIEDVLEDLEGADVEILTLMRKMYAMLSGAGQAKIATEGI